jgi:hypothetical protein
MSAAKGDGMFASAQKFLPSTRANLVPHTRGTRNFLIRAWSIQVPDGKFFTAG